MKLFLLNLFLLLCITLNATSPSIGGYNVYYGHLHNHTSYSDGAGTPADAFKYAKNKAKLDFFGISDHDSYLDSLKWSDTKNQADAYNQDGVFSTFYGFEWSSNQNYGHVTVIGTPDYTTTATTNTFENLKTWLSTRQGIAFFNHPGRENNNNKEFDHFKGTLSDKFVGIELWNKTDGFDTYYYNDGYTNNDNSKGYYDEALGLGWKVGASGSGDDHNGTWGNAEDSRLAILSGSLTRSDLWEALQARRFYSTMNKNIALSFKINNNEMGSTLTPGTYTFQVQASDADGEEFTNVELYDKDHNVVQSWTPNSEKINLTTNRITTNGDYYYVKVKEEDGVEAISSPIWIVATDTLAPTAFTATLGTITGNSAELLLNATDNSGLINYSISYGPEPTVIHVSGVSATQKSCFITGLLPTTTYTFTVTAEDNSLNQAANSPIALVAKTIPLPTYNVTSSPVVTSPYLLSYLTDGDPATSWKVMSPHASYVTFEYSTAQTFNKLTLTSSDDNESRDPKNWSVKASNDTLSGWTVLNTQSKQSFASRELAKIYTFVNNVAYKFYRLQIAESNYSTSSTMLGELAFGSDIKIPAKDTIPPTAFTATQGIVTQNSVELLLKATDNSGSINYTVSYGSIPNVINVTGISGIQSSCIVSGLSPGTNYTFSVIAKDSMLNPAPNNPIAVMATTTSLPTLVVTSSPGVPSPYLLSYLTDGNPATSWKVLSPHISFVTFEYSTAQTFNKLTLTSSGDNESRDPKNWSVKASNDTLSGWTVLNTQSKQSFATRELAKTYTFTNNVAYKFYRLHITESNYSTTSTMLGELAFGSDIQIPVKDTIPPTAFSAALGAVTKNSVELLLKATDNSGSIIYTVSYGSIPTVINVAGVSGIQSSCIVSGLSPGTSYTFSVIAKDSMLNPAPNNPITVVANTTSPPTLVVTSSPGVPSPYSLSYLTDGNPATSWKVLSPHVSYITFEYLTSQTFNKLTLTSSGDNESCDPKNWTVKAANDTVTGWTVLNTQSNQSFASRELAKTYTFMNNVAYKFYRLHITESNNSTTSTMLGELAFGTEIQIPAKDTIPPTAFTATLGTVTKNSVELLLKATDNSGSVTYTVSYGPVPTVINVTGVSGIQSSCIVSGLTPGTNYTFSVIAKDSMLNPAPNNPIAVMATTTSLPTLVVTSSPGVPSPYSLSYLTDGNPATSWKVLSPHVSYVTFAYSTAQTFNKLTLTSSDDNESRDPKNWSVKASNDTLTGWTVLNTQTKQSFASRELAKTYTFTNNVAYKFYRLHITESNYSTTSTMLGELSFWSEIQIPVKDTIPPTAFTVTPGAVTKNSVELLLKATDNSGSVNYTISYGPEPTVINVTGVSGIQTSCIVSGLTPGTGYSFSVIAKDSTLNPAANNPVTVVANTSLPPTLVVTSSPVVPSPYSLSYLTDGNPATSWKVLSPHVSYVTFEYSTPQIFNKLTLTSSGDNESRDPKNWTVKASNDTLAGWTVLNTQSKQSFASRELAKTYTFTNNVAYKFYRLHITESNYSTTSTMLGELAFGSNIALESVKINQNLMNDSLSIKADSLSDKINVANKQIKIYYSDRTLIVQNMTDKKGDLYLYTIYGRLIMKQPIESKTATTLLLNYPAGIYLVTGILSYGKITQKIIMP